MKIVLAATLMLGLSACSPSDFSGSRGLGPGDDSRRPADSGSDEEDEPADDPVQVTGGFLTLGCGQLTVDDGVGELAPYARRYGCSLFDATNVQFAGAVKDVFCENPVATDLKVIEQPAGSAWHFHLGLNSPEPDPLASTRCGMTADGKEFKAAAPVFTQAGPGPGKQALLLAFDQNTCGSARLNTLLSAPPVVTSPNCLTAGRKGNALSFDGVNTYVTLPLQKSLAELLQGSYTLAFWFRTPGSNSPYGGSYMTVIGQKDDNGGEDIALEIRYCTTGSCQGYLTVAHGSADDPDTEDTASALSPNTWYYVTVTKQENIMSLYLDGVLQGADDLSKSAVLLNSDLLIGRSGADTDSMLKGALDEFSVWSGVLDENAIRAAMSGQQ